MSRKNTDRFVHIGDEQYIEFYTIKGVYPAAEAGGDDFSQMMNANGLFKRTVILLENGDTMGSTEDVQVILARIDQAKDPDSEAEFNAGCQEAAVETMYMLANEMENSIPADLDPETVQAIKGWLLSSADATRESGYDE